ncbi:MAG: hypothetical protein ACP5SH_13570 [Syntrophobacteraceae bacterium]
MKRNIRNASRTSSASRLTWNLRIAGTIATLLSVLLLVAGCAHTDAAASKPAELPSAVSTPRRANFEGQPRSRDAQHVADWVMDSGDNHGMPFLIVDKTDAKVFVFDAGGYLLGEAPCLIGLEKGDVCQPGIGKKKLWQITPKMRITPAGRSVAELGPDLKGNIVLWVDYHGGVAMHWVVTNNPRERRLQRIASPDPLEHRISYGCINIPDIFFDNVVEPTFSGKKGIAYVLPEVKSNKQVFRSYYRVDKKTSDRPRQSQPGT